VATKLQIVNRAARHAGETRRIEDIGEASLVATTCADVYDDFVREALEAREWPWARVKAPLTEVGEQVKSYTGDGATTLFVVPYDIGDASQLTVTVNGAAVELGTGYTFTPPDGGFAARVTFLAAPANGAAIKLVVTTTRVGWDYVFTLPTDCVRPLALLLEGERRELIPSKQRLPFEVVPNNARTGYLLCTESDEFEVLEYVAHITEATMYPPHFVEALALRLAAHLLDAVKKAPDEAVTMMARYENAVAVAFAVANNAAGVPACLDSPGLVAHGGGWTDGRWRSR
jgi:hypothetical protein